MVKRGGRGNVYASIVPGKIMRICPHCGKRIPDDNNNIYCPVCNQIADEEVLLRMKIEKKIRKPEQESEPIKKSASKSVNKVSSRRKEYDGDTVKISDDKNPYLSTIISIVVVAAIIAAVFYFVR